jgi:hypothetical protein
MRLMTLSITWFDGSAQLVDVQAWDVFAEVLVIMYPEGDVDVYEDLIAVNGIPIGDYK